MPNARRNALGGAVHVRKKALRGAGVRKEALRGAGVRKRALRGAVPASALIAAPARAVVCRASGAMPRLNVEI